MPAYDHICTECQHEWTEFYSINDAIPGTCPSCKIEGKVKRLISGLPMVKVVLTGQDLKKSMAADTQKLRQEMKTNEKLRANVMGEDAYNRQVVSDDKFKDRYKNI